MLALVQHPVQENLRVVTGNRDAVCLGKEQVKVQRQEQASGW